MPTVLRIGPYRFFFFASDRNEPIHIEREDRIAKFWLDPIRLQSSSGFSRNEMARIQSIISKPQIQPKEAWHAYFHD